MREERYIATEDKMLESAMERKKTKTERKRGKGKEKEKAKDRKRRSTHHPQKIS